VGTASGGPTGGTARIGKRKRVKRSKRIKESNRIKGVGRGGIDGTGRIWTRPRNEGVGLAGKSAVALSPEAKAIRLPEREGPSRALKQA
jgi:hypothetical protein